jgi:hypothetical protein
VRSARRRVAACSPSSASCWGLRDRACQQSAAASHSRAGGGKCGKLLRCGGIGSAISLGTTCNECLATNCCSQAEACGNDPDCAGLTACVLTCKSDDTACQSACGTQYPNGATLAQPVADCLASSCATASCRPCGGLEITLGLSATCGACLEVSCCKVAAECANDAACVALVQCVMACSGDTTCQTQCQSSHSAA